MLQWKAEEIMSRTLMGDRDHKEGSSSSYQLLLNLASNTDLAVLWS